MTKLTPASARDLPTKGVLRDHEVSGLSLVANKDSKSWLFYYRTKSGVERRPQIGRFPEISLSRAREIAKEMKVRIQMGEDPSAERQASRGIPTVSELCDAYIEKWAKKRLAESSLKQHQQLIDVQIKPGLGRLRVTDVTSEIIDKFLEKVFNRHFVKADTRKLQGPTAHWTAKHTKNALSMIFKRLPKLYKIKLEDDPFEDTKVYERILRKRYASPEEIQKISDALDELTKTHPYCAACIWTLFLTGGRVSEIVNLREDQISTNIKGESVITLEKHKTYRRSGEKKVMLPKQAADIISKLPAAKPGERVFGNLLRRYIEKVWEDIRTSAGCPDLKLLDARRTFASFGLSNDLTLEQIGDLLGHSDVQTTKGYSYLIDELKQRKAAMIATAIVNAAQTKEKEPV